MTAREKLLEIIDNRFSSFGDPPDTKDYIADEILEMIVADIKDTGGGSYQVTEFIGIWADNNDVGWK